MSTLKARTRSHAWVSEFGPVCCGRIVRIDEDRRPCVDFPGNGGDPIVARCLGTLRLEGGASVGDLQVLLVFEHGDPARPIIVGVVESLVQARPGTPAASAQAGIPRHAVVDGRRVTLQADEEVTLVCGRASITLTKDGRISLRGVEIVSRALSANKIRGASVSIN